MNREFHSWYSESLGKKMECLVFGHFGIPFLVFPTSKGRFFEWEDFGMIKAIEWAINEGKIKLFCIDSVDEMSWYSSAHTPKEQMLWHNRYEQYVLTEVLPFIDTHCNTPDIGIILAGSSFGAFHAMSMFLRYPQKFIHCFCLSGIFHLKNIMPIYYNEYKPFDPADILAQPLGKSIQYELLKEIGPIIYCGQGAFEEKMIQSSKQISEQLTKKNIPHIFNLWGSDVDHHWYWWGKQFNDFLTSVLPNL